MARSPKALAYPVIEGAAGCLAPSEVGLRTSLSLSGGRGRGARRSLSSERGHGRCAARRTGDRLDHGRIVVVDGAAALVLAVACEVLGLVVRAGAGYLVLSSLLLAPLTVRRARPEICLVVVSGVALVQWLTVGGSVGILPADVAVPIAVHAAAAYGRVWAGRAGLAVTLLEAVLGGVILPLLPSPAWAHLLVGAFFASSGAAAWAVGGLQRVRRRQVAALAERARLLEIERDQRDRLAVLAERSRIVREMHDVVAHSLAVVIAQADGGRYAGTGQNAHGVMSRNSGPYSGSVLRWAWMSRQ